tara:strand:+ start:477 stop:1028 length:552 start_codon:yes stop_codon:yes gene_type:complete
MNMKKIKESDLEIKPFRGATFQQFQKFLDSLEDEKKTWSLDLKDKNLKEYFLSYCENGLGLLAVLDEEVVGIVNSYLIFDNTNKTIAQKYLSYLDMLYNKDNKNAAEISICVKEGIQKRGIGTALMTAYDGICQLYNINFIFAKHTKDNMGSNKLFSKAGYIPFKWNTEKANKAWDFKIKKYE